MIKVNLRITLQIAPGDEGMTESHTYLLKEIKTVSQCTTFLYGIVAPFLGTQADLNDTPMKRAAKRKKKPMPVAEEDEGLPWDETVEEEA